MCAIALYVNDVTVDVVCIIYVACDDVAIKYGVAYVVAIGVIVVVIVSVTLVTR